MYTIKASDCLSEQQLFIFNFTPSLTEFFPLNLAIRLRNFYNQPINSPIVDFYIE